MSLVLCAIAIVACGGATESNGTQDAIDDPRDGGQPEVGELEGGESAADALGEPDADVISLPTPDGCSVEDFATDVQPIFDVSCAAVGCHQGTTPTAGLDLSAGRAYGALVSKPSGECPSMTLVVPGDAKRSVLWIALNGGNGNPGGTCRIGPAPPPTASPPLPRGELETIRCWIDEGAKP